MRHPLHSICPYFAMFPEEFVRKQVLAYTRPGDQVFDPFCGRGTAVFESLLNGRNAAGTDINPVAACVAAAKSAPPSLDAVNQRLAFLRRMFAEAPCEIEPNDDFFRACFHTSTLRQILYLRQQLAWQTCPVDRFIAAVALGCLHGESHKSPNYLSNRMPRTISTKPGYSVRWWSQRGLLPPAREAFDILQRVAAYRLSRAPLTVRGTVLLEDARRASEGFSELRNSVHLMVTSPPYVDTTDFREDQWLRLWFLGGPDRPIKSAGDDRYRSLAPYWNFLLESWKGCSALMRRGSVVVIRIGGKAVSQETLYKGLFDSVQAGFAEFRAEPIHSGVATEIRNRQTNAFRPGTSSSRFEYDFAFSLA
jgi:hypothetical protein